MLPGGTRGNLVYLYPGQVKDGVYPYGGDFRYFVSPDGATIYEKRQMHKSVLESVPAQIPKGGRRRPDITRTFSPIYRKIPTCSWC